MTASITGFTALSDVIEPAAWNDYVLVKSTELSRFRQSGILVDLSAELMTQMAGPTVNMPYFNDLTGNDDVLDDTNDLTVNNITTGKDISVKLARGKAYGASDLSADLSGGDPMAVIGNRFANFWMRKEQSILLNVVAGALGSVANAGYNGLDISALTGTAANFDPHGFLDACGLLGDHQDSLAGVAVHSDTYKVMKKQDLIDFIKPSDGGMEIPVYQGKHVIVDDTMPKSGSTYTSYIFGPGAIGFATAAPRRPVGFERRELVGGGMEFLVHRRYMCMHLRGVKWVGTAAGNSPTNAELATIGNWTKLYDSKLIRAVLFKHKLGA